MKLNKKQKRTATIASMAALLAVVLGMGGQTFAKYIETTTTQAQNVVVAKWGVVAQIKDKNGAVDSSAKMFQKSYNNNAVEAATGNDNALVAPGTSGSIETVITGTPEVATRVEYTFSLDDVFLKDSSNEYYPIQWQLSINSSVVVPFASGSSVAANIASKVNALSTTYDANTNLKTIEVKLEWKWEFDGSADSTFNNVDTTDIADDKFTKDDLDSILGDAAAAGATDTYQYNPTTLYQVDWKLAYSFGVSIEQVETL